MGDERTWPVFKVASVHLGIGSNPDGGCLGASLSVLFPSKGPFPAWCAEGYLHPSPLGFSACSGFEGTQQLVVFPDLILLAPCRPRESAGSEFCGSGMWTRGREWWWWWWEGV